MQKLLIAVAGIAIAVLGTVRVEPAQAALIDFNFSTDSGATGAFTLKTNTPASSSPALFESDITGIAYLGAVSNFSISAPYINLNNVTADFAIVPSITSDLVGLPANLGILSGVSYPPGCITSPGLTCLFDVGIVYSGNQTERTILSDNPLSYSRGVGIDFFDPITHKMLIRDNINNFSVASRQVPEPSNGFSILASGIGGALFLLKRKERTKKKEASTRSESYSYHAN